MRSREPPSAGKIQLQVVRHWTQRLSNVLQPTLAQRKVAIVAVALSQHSIALPRSKPEVIVDWAIRSMRTIARSRFLVTSRNHYVIKFDPKESGFPVHTWRTSHAPVDS